MRVTLAEGHVISVGLNSVFKVINFKAKPWQLVLFAFYIFFLKMRPSWMYLCESELNEYVN